MNHIVKEIAADAARKGISAQHICDVTGLDRKTVSSILDGTAENPRCESVYEISKALGGHIYYSHDGEKKTNKTDDLIMQALKVKDRWIKWLFYTCVGLIVIDAITTIIAFVIASKY